ncbi:hypothetical protein OPT61_g9742 [Boeremia exigua]|uniref:Uncharacterized protein n=1 Tax=Boeremia exigua TaxID=749465 RepID=A0ACC2HTN0_9PLEO|nr:hypothetical protein OPT61_g9742 [Boeremia exigua]
MRFSTTLLSEFLALNAMPIAAESGYYSTCHDFKLQWDHQMYKYALTATCREPSGIYNVHDTLWLENCFENAWGHLLPKAGYASDLLMRRHLFLINATATLVPRAGA